MGCFSFAFLWSAQQRSFLICLFNRKYIKKNIYGTISPGQLRHIVNNHERITTADGYRGIPTYIKFTMPNIKEVMLELM